MGQRDFRASSDQLHDRIIAAATDGRCHNVRYRQNQMQLLHVFLCKNGDRICHAIQQDSSGTEDEALSEYYFALSSLRTLYDQLNFDYALVEEYSIKTNKSNTRKRAPHGIIMIRPGNYSRFFSIISPFVAAVAAGNCVLIELPNTLRLVDQVVREAMAVMDHDAFIVTNSTASDEDFLSKCFIIDQTTNTMTPGPSVQPANRKMAVAVIHRTANVIEAANSICTARLRFNGGSPYAPDIVLVNEWVKKDFIQACLQNITKQAASLAIQNMSIPSEEPSDNSLLSDAECFDILYSSSQIQFLELKDRTWTSLPRKIKGRNLILLSVTGLIDAVSSASQFASLNVCYAFASLADAKFISQKIDSDVTFVNQIPVHILVGPAVTKDDYSAGSLLRYDIMMMSKPHPEFVNTARESHELVAEVLSTNVSYQKDLTKRVRQLRLQALTPLTPTGQASGTSMGFFDQGILTGIVAFVLPTLCLASVGAFYAGRSAYRYFI